MNCCLTQAEYNAIRNELNKYKDNLNEICHKAHEDGAFSFAHDMKMRIASVNECLRIITDVHMRYE